MYQGNHENFLIISKYINLRISVTSYFHSPKHQFLKLLSLAVCQSDVCHPNGSLSKRNSIKSGNGVYEFILQENGNLELKCNDTLLWSSDTKNSDVEDFQFQSDGNLVIRKKNGTYAWESQTVYDGSGPNGPPDRLILQNDGNVVLYAGREAKWSTGTRGKCASGKFSNKIIFLSLFI